MINKRLPPYSPKSSHKNLLYQRQNQYVQMPDLEAQDSPTPQYKSFDDACSALAARLYELSSRVNNISKLLGRHQAKAAKKPRSGASASEAAEFDERIVKLAEETTDMFRASKSQVQAVAEWSFSGSGGGARQGKEKLAQERLNREFGAVLAQFRGQQREIAELQRQQLVRSKTAVHEEEEALRQQKQNESTPLLSGSSSSGQYAGTSQTQILDMVRQEDVDFQTTLLHERESEIANIQHGITEINAIFRDLGTLVTQQGDQLDAFENNVSNLASNTKQAGDELVAANEYQRKKRNCSLCVLVVLVVVVLVIVLAVIAS